MNTKLFYTFSAEINKAEEEFKLATEKWKRDKSLENTIAKDLAQVKLSQWQKAMNYLYIKSE